MFHDAEWSASLWCTTRQATLKQGPAGHCEISTINHSEPQNDPSGAERAEVVLKSHCNIMQKALEPQTEGMRLRTTAQRQVAQEAQRSTAQGRHLERTLSLRASMWS